MNLLKVSRDKFVRIFLGKDYIPEGLFTYSEYFRNFKVINFDEHKEGDIFVAVSTDFKYGSIITSGKNKQELERNIKDAILTSFDIPSVYADKTGLHKIGEHENSYAPA